MPGKNERQGRSTNIFFFHEGSLQGHDATIPISFRFLLDATRMPCSCFGLDDRFDFPTGAHGAGGRSLRKRQAADGTGSWND